MDDSGKERRRRKGGAVRGQQWRRGKEHFAGVQKVGLKELGEGNEEEAGKGGEARRC